MSGLQLARNIMSGGLLGMAPRQFGLVVLAPMVAAAAGLMGVTATWRAWPMLSLVLAAVPPVGLLRMSMIDHLEPGGIGAFAVFGCAAVVFIVHFTAQRGAESGASSEGLEGEVSW